MTEYHHPSSPTTVLHTNGLTTDTIDLVASNYREAGFDFMQYTPHKIARELLMHDERFKGADYTRLVSVITHWQRGFAL
jgi:hypothetical protein